jgi:hypothetical protein
MLGKNGSGKNMSFYLIVCRSWYNIKQLEPSCGDGSELNQCAIKIVANTMKIFKKYDQLWKKIKFETSGIKCNLVRVVCFSVRQLNRVL